MASRTLRPDQRQAFDHAVGSGGLKVIEGRAGTGKSYVLQAVRAAHERTGLRVIGLAPTNAVAQDLKAEGFTEAATAHSELFRLKNGRTSWDRRTVVVVDEAAMLDSRVTGELLAEARRARAKVILAGDDRQLASIERGGLFSELRQRHGSAEISEITRQRTDWQRHAARDLAEGRFAEAVAAFDRAGAITWTQDQVDARVALVAAWRRDTAAEPDATRFVFAYTNRDVDALNAELRQVRRDRGELLGPDVRFETKHGPAEFAPGDRVQFTDTLKAARIYNGNVGTITDIDARTGVIRARMDSTAAGQGREVMWSASEFIGFRHGYAGTIYKGQGKTLDHTYLYHTHHWRSAASYVALTRQRESAQVFVARETARDAPQLARQMAREEIKAASVAWATLDELTPAMRERAVRDRQVELAADRQAEAEPRHRAEASHGQRVATPSPPAVPPPRPGRDERAAPEILIPGYVDPSGRDSLGRGLDAGSIAAVVAADRTVRQRAGGALVLPAWCVPRPARGEGAARRDGEAPGLDQHRGPHRTGSNATRRIARPDGALRQCPGQDRARHGGRDGRRHRARSGAHRRGGGEGRADLSGQRGSAAQGRRHPHSEAQRARRGGGCHARGGHGRQGPCGAMAQRDGGPGARSRAAALL